MMSHRRNNEKRLAQALYEDLEDEEKQAFHNALAESPDLQAEFRALRELVDSVPMQSPTPEQSLWPGVSERLERPRRVVPLLPRWGLAAAAFVLVGIGVLYWIAVHPPAAVAPGIEVAEEPSEPTIESDALAPVMREAAALAETRRYPEAYTLLAEAATEAQGDPAAAHVVQAMADLAFEELQWYPEAFMGYDALRRDYVAQFEAESHNFLRLNMLDEARDADGDYPALHELDAARRRRDFGAYERVVARYPATYVASVAANEMAALAGVEANDPAGRVRAMELAAARSTNPVAKAQLRLETAHRIRDDLQHSDRARSMYEQIANSGITRIAEAAQSELDEWRIETEPQP